MMLLVRSSTKKHLKIKNTTRNGTRNKIMHSLSQNQISFSFSN